MTYIDFVAKSCVEWLAICKQLPNVAQAGYLKVLRLTFNYLPATFTTSSAVENIV